ncbi:hypothetical protein P691DRAFT_739419 [Macrolepiota fuliginosa MF-IS2]|uniref:Protein kinase domain-containing protein n=1 Tax=Macrolepiota fuliginosa MF-IS2 TaxID=1400762 RepID=A0A9P5X093_9AGAR|nr:hypothetical protein P691DRAFT_739419 [Macrolepiota fuliginosa MF-IS2]
MELVRVELGEAICGFTFGAEELGIRNKTAPMVIYLPGDLFDSEGKVTPQVEHTLHRAIECTPSLPSIIVTNFKVIGVFSPPKPDRAEAVFERVATTQFSLTLRVVSFAYLNKALPSGVFINIPRPDLDTDGDFILPEGPPQDPSQPLLADEQVLATCHHNSDFDLVTLVRDRARALQFFRWHNLVQQQCLKLVAHPDDTLAAVTNKAGHFLSNIRPIYPPDTSELPTDTTMHLGAIQRESPLVVTGIDKSLQESKRFTLKIQGVVAEGSEHGLCTVYRCLITSIDGEPVPSPSLCLKLFDDRFLPLLSPGGDDGDNDEHVYWWFDQFFTAEQHARNEDSAYEKLCSIQGSIIPWFYGTHQFILPDGVVLYGLLMEYIEGYSLDSGFVRGLSPDRQIKIIQSCRHACRILHIANVSQRDWHHGQVLFFTDSGAGPNHAVLIDFASTTQTWELEEPNFINNYLGLICVLLGREGDVGINSELVWEHFGEPDDWDAVWAIVPVVPNGEERKLVKAADMFPYISST